MDPLSLIFSAIVAGASAALKPTAEQAVKDGYEGLKALIKSRWRRVGVEAIEGNPSAPERQKILKEDLQAAGTLDDREVLAKAQEVLNAVKTHDPKAAEAAGITVRDLDIAGTVNLDDLIAEGAIRAEGIKAGGDFNLRGARAGNPRSR
jgi:hypothetical protein